MPLYEYECTACGHRFEVIQRFSDAPIEHCQKCNGEVHKLLSAPAIQFKGTGWYVTDYAGKNSSGASSKTSEGDAPKSDKADASKSSSSSDSSTSSSSDSSSSTKSDTKPSTNN